MSECDRWDGGSAQLSVLKFEEFEVAGIGWQKLALNDRHSEAFQAMVVENKTSGRQAMHKFYERCHAMPCDAKANVTVREAKEVSKSFSS